MDKGLKIKYWVDVAMAITLLITAITGIINLFMMLLETEDSNKFLGVNPSFWLMTHVIFAVTTVLLVVFHLLLHKDWIVFASKKAFEKTEQ
jgi:hypothetical protein